MDFDQSVTLQNSDGINQVPVASRNRLEMGNMVWDSVSIAVADNMTHREDIIVGNSLFKNKILEIDYDKKIVVIHDTLPTIDDGYSQHDIVLDGGTVPFIEGSLNFRGKTQKGWMMVDLGAYTSIFNTADVPATNKMLNEAKKLIGLNNHYSVPSLVIGNDTFSGFNYSTQKFNGDGYQAILGSDLLKRFNFVLDNLNGHLYFKRNSHTQDPYRNPEYIVVRVAARLGWLVPLSVISLGHKCEILEDKGLHITKTVMAEFWEQAFNDRKEMWGLEPAKSTILTKDFFVEHKVKNVLIPGIGYGRNAQVFIDKGMSVTGI